jgi:hypothetical protein
MGDLLQPSRVPGVDDFNSGASDELYADAESLPAVGGEWDRALIDPWSCDRQGLLLAFRMPSGAVYQLVYVLVEGDG